MASENAPIAPPRPKVAFLGPVSSYSHQVRDLAYYHRPAWTFGLTDANLAQAAIECFPPTEFEYFPQVTIGGMGLFRRQCLPLGSCDLNQLIDIFDVVQKGDVEHGVIPFENSTNGSVVFTLDLLADRNNKYPDLYLCGETYLDVHHYLVGRSSKTLGLTYSPEVSSGVCTPTSSTPNPERPRATPLSDLKHVKRIFSHPQAFGQCDIFLHAYLKGVERIDVSSTSKAAEMVACDETGTSAAIASSIASEIHKVDVLAKGIEDREDNTTRFFVIRNGLNQSNRPKIDEGAPTKSLVSFTVDHRSPGALADILDCFRRYKLNLTSINSRPSKLVPFQYIFFLEFEGSKLDDPEGVVKDALECVSTVAKDSRWWGSWEDKLRR